MKDGHFLIAKLCKIKVNEFALGFGPTILKIQGKETKYALRLIPLGGFVSMEGEEERSDKEGSFSKAPIIKRIAIVAAGGLVNIIFGIVIFFGLATTNSNISTNKIENLMDGYNAQIIGLQVNDEIVKINNKRIINNDDISAALMESKGSKVNVVVKRNGELLNFDIVPNEQKYKKAGIYFREGVETKIAAIDVDSPAEKQGLKVNDIVTKINGIEVKNNIRKLTETINNAESNTLEFIVERHGKEKTILVDVEEESSYLLGVYLKKADNTLGNKIYYGIHDTVNFVLSIGENLKELVTGKAKSSQLMGPVGISSVVSNTQGIREYIEIISLISLSLGITNLLPFPPLDGGKIVLLIIEAIRRKPLKEKTETSIQMAGFCIMIALAIIITYKDIVKIF